MTDTGHTPGNGGDLLGNLLDYWIITGNLLGLERNAAVPGGSSSLSHVSEIPYITLLNFGHEKYYTTGNTGIITGKLLDYWIITE